MPFDVLVDLTVLDTPSRFDGTGRYVRDLGRALALLGEPSWQGLSIGALTALDGPTPLGRLDWGGSPELGWSAGDEVRWLMARRTRLVRTLRRLRPRLLHATYHMGTPRGSGVPRVTSCFDLLRLVMHEQYLPGRPLYRRLLRGIESGRFHGARRVHAISRHTADDLVRLLGVPSRKIDVIYQGIDHDRFRPRADRDDDQVSAVLRRHALDEGSYVVYVGNADPRKNVDVLISAFVRARIDGLVLLLLGRQRPVDQHRIAQWLRAEGNPPTVRSLGYLPDEELATLYSGALGFVFCSTYEGFGLTPVEAMACGCPVIHTGLTSMRETVADAGLLVPARDVDATSAALRRLAAEPSLRADLRRAGLVRAKRFDFLRTARETLESYGQALR